MSASFDHGATCGCCAGISVQTPSGIDNRPGLSAIAYRIGTHRSFKGSMLASLGATDNAVLRRFGARDDDDFTIALIDAWATTLDVLTFYQERIANECHLGTATERRSILELARLLGYQPAPPVAAATHLAFKVDAIPGAPPEVPIDAGAKVQSLPGPNEQPQIFETIEPIVARAEWSALQPQTRELRLPQLGDTSILLEGTATNLRPGDAILFVGAERKSDPSREEWDLRRIKRVTAEPNPDPALSRTRVEWSEPLGHPLVPVATSVELFALRFRGALWGHSAPDWRAMSAEVKTSYGSPSGSQWPGFKTFTIGKSTSPLGPEIHVDGTHPEITVGSWLVLSISTSTELYRVTASVEDARANFAISGKTQRVSLSGENHLDFDSHVRDTSVLAHSEELTLAARTISAPLPKAVLPLAAKVAGLARGRKIIVEGREVGAAASAPKIGELATVFAIDDSDPNRTKLVLEKPLLHDFDRSTVIIHANVAKATQGETVHEIVGDGDASVANQRFLLKQSPLTHLSASTPSGSESTLELFANDLLYREVPTLYGRGAKERVYVKRGTEQGRTVVELGDGVEGVRLPSGQGNVRARYRKGAGAAGNLDAGRLTSLMSRPLGLSGVVSPLPATGGADAEKLEDARTNAPLAVMTLDRVVSLSDYQSFARAFPGIAKAKATWSWLGHERAILVTVAGTNGAPVPEDSEVAINLTQALRLAGVPHVAVRLESFVSVRFPLGVRIRTDPELAREAVMINAEAALRTAFAFEARTFDQPVTQSEVIRVLHAVKGVAAVQVVAPSVALIPASNEILTLEDGPLQELGVFT